MLGQLNARLAALVNDRARTKATQPTSEEHHILDATRATYACRDLFEHPDYHVCFPVLGSSGCGKTHFIASLLADSPTAERDTLALPLRVDGPQRDVGEWICRSVAEAAGVGFDDVATLDGFLAGEDLRLVLILDDLHDMLRRWPGMTGALRAFIEMHSHRERIRWIATLLDTHYDEVLHGEDFWASYGVADDASLSGWLAADQCNEREHLGHRLLDERGQGRISLDQRTRTGPQRRTRTLLDAYLTDPSFRAADARLQPALWFAAAKASAKVQRAVVTRASELLSRDLGPRSAFSVLYFVQNATGVDRPALFHLVQPLFHDIAASQLQRYLLHAVRRQLDAEDDAVQIARALASLVGAEVMGIEEELAEVAIAALEARCAPGEAMIPLIIEHVATARVPPGTPRPRRGESTWRQWLFHAMCDRLLHVHGIGTFALLSAAGWYAGRSGRSALSGSVTIQMRSAANLAFGHWYRTRKDRRERADYEALVEQLMQSKLASERELAFYLIRHSVATHKEKAVPVAPQFRNALDRLWRDPALTALRERWGPFFDVNLRR